MAKKKEKEYIAKDEKRLNVWVLPFSSKGCDLGDFVKGKKFYGTKHTQETKQKTSIAMKEHYKKHDSYWKGKSLSEETKKKISETLKKRRGAL